MRSIRRWACHGFFRALAVTGVYATRKTGRSAIVQLIRSLRPITTSRPLVRLGPRGDGGYLVPDDLQGIEACLSPGVSDMSGFELDCAHLGMKVHLADASVDGPADNHEAFIFTKRFIGATSVGEFLTMDDWVAQASLKPTSDLLLQMDIEGSEYEALLSMSTNLLKRFRIIVIEFHGFDNLWSQPFFNLAARAVEKLLVFHSCVHIHPNNCCGSIEVNGIELPRVVEMTFQRNDRITDRTFVSKLPNELDSDNTTNPSLALSRVWLTDKLTLDN